MDFSIIFIVPLIFGLVSDSSWQNTFCNIEIVNQLEFLECDQLRDTFKIEAGTNVNIDVIPENDTLKFSSNAVSMINSNDTTFATNGGTFLASEDLNELWFVSDGSILIEFINYTGGVE